MSCDQKIKYFVIRKSECTLNYGYSCILRYNGVVKYSIIRREK